MAKISSLTLLGAAPADDDEFVILDVSDTTQGAGGSTKGLVASRVALTGATNTFTAAQTVNNVTEALTLSHSSDYVRARLGSTTECYLDFYSAATPTTGTQLSRLLGNVASNYTILSHRGASGSLRFETTTSGGTRTEAARFTDAQYLLLGYTTSNGAYRLQVNSQIYATNATVATSDERVKENVETMVDGLAAVMALRPVVFNFVEHEVHNFSTDRQVGFIAQEIEEALAEDDYLRCIVPETQNEEQLKGVAGDKIVALLVRAVQQQQAQIEALTARVVALESA